MAQSPLLISSELYRMSRHASGHPLAIPRVSLATDLCRALGWVAEDQYREAVPASDAEMTRFHCPEYVAAVRAAETTQTIGEAARRRFNLGINGNPVYPEMFRRPAMACGAALLGARALLGGAAAVYSPAGGTHHGQRDRASGFCTFNDPVLAILLLLDGGLTRVFYLDLDAHFGDGVQAALADDERVFTCSIHERGRWPMARDGSPQSPGGLADRGQGRARNLPLPEGANDDEFEYLIETAVLPLLSAFAPEAVVIQGGSDALADDPMARLELSNIALWRAVAAVRDEAPRLLVLGGGGYNPFAVARCWTGIWGVLNRHAPPQRLLPEAEAHLRAVRWNHRHGRTPPDHWFTTLADAPRHGPIREEIRAIAAAILA